MPLDPDGPVDGFPRARGWSRRRAVVVSFAVLLVVAAVAAARGTAVEEARVSDLEGPQNEPSIAIDPTDPDVLVAGSNSFAEGVTRTYSSTDGGRTWTTRTPYPRPPSRAVSCAADPGLVIGPDGRQTFSYIRTSPCSATTSDPDAGDLRPGLFTSSRSGPDAEWEPRVRVAPLGRARADDKPTIAADLSVDSPHRGRLYVVWSRIQRNTTFVVLLSSSDDGGRTWSAPVRVNRTGKELVYATVAVAANGWVYVAWEDAGEFRLNVTRSTDGGRTFGPEVQGASFVIVTIPSCGSGTPIRALKLQCVHSAPLLSVDTSAGRFRGRVYLSYAQTDFQGGQGIRLTVFDPALRTVYGFPRTRLGYPVTGGIRGRRQQFWPSSAVDASNGAYWVCYYDTKGDPDARSARYTCTASTDGGRTFRPPVPVATVRSDVTQDDSDPRGYGDYESVAVADGVAHPIWTDTRHNADRSTEIYTARLRLADLR